MKLTLLFLFAFLTFAKAARSSYIYDVNVKLGGKPFDEVRGELSLVLDVKNISEEKVYELSREAEMLEFDKIYKYAVVLDHPIDDIKVADIRFQEKSLKRFIPFRTKPVIRVQYVELVPMYKANKSNRLFSKKVFCTPNMNKNYLKIQSGERSSLKSCRADLRLAFLRF